MMNPDYFQFAILIWLALAGVVFVALFFVRAPYGRHMRSGWGPGFSNTLGWILMETPSVLIFAGMFLWGERVSNAVAWAFFSFWQAHYVHRSWIFPFKLHKRKSSLPLLVLLMGVAFNAVNASTNGYYLFFIAPLRGALYFADLRFVVGALLFFGGMFLNVKSDYTLLKLRCAGSEYSIPSTGFFKWVSCPNYLGEIIEWTGWAILTWSSAGLAFAVWTAVNLGHRAYANHKWYKERFPDYPTERKALIPYLG
ncbi:MAG: methyltransferase [Pseudomonadota bacterium]